MRRAVSALWVVVLLALCGTVAAVAAGSSKPQLAGTWSGHYGGAYSGKFTLRWAQTGSRLHGTIALSNPRGKYSVSGSVHGSAITFGAVGAGATYTGSVSGKSMSGKYKTRSGGGNWSARKTS